MRIVSSLAPLLCACAVLALTASTSTAQVADFDGDGVNDLLVREALSPGGAHERRVVLYSGATGTVIHTFDAPVERSLFAIDCVCPGEADGFSERSYTLVRELQNANPSDYALVTSIAVDLLGEINLYLGQFSPSSEPFDMAMVISIYGYLALSD